MFWILATIGLALFISVILSKTYKYWERRGVPQAKPWFYWKSIFLTLTGKQTATDNIKYLYNNFPEQRFAGVYQFHVPSLLIRDPDVIKLITVKDFDHFVDHNHMPIEDPLWKRNLFSLKGDEWRRTRAVLSPSFTSSKMKIMFGLMCECAEQFTNHFESKCEETLTLEFKEHISRYTIDVIASVAFGLKCDSLKEPNNEFFVKGKAATNFNGISFIVIFLFPFIANILGLKVFSKDISNFFIHLITDTIKYREANGIVRLDMLHLLMQARKGKLKDESTNTELSAEEIEAGKSLTDEDITAHALVFFLAGFESVSSEMCFVCYELAINPEVQKRLQDEIDKTLKSCDGKITYDSLQKMKYLDMVVSETLRKWPTLVVSDRMCVKPYTIEPTLPDEKPIHLKPGDLVALPIHAIQNDPQFYPNPDKFDPERFSEENKININPYTYLTFGIGPRSCIGNRFAILEIKTLIFHIFSKFDVIVVEKTAIPLKISKNPVNVTAEGGFWLGLKRRKLEGA